MEIILAVGGILIAWLHGYSRGKRKNSVVTMSARDLRRELKKRQ